MADDAIARQRRPVVEWAAAARALEPGSRSGDRYVVTDRPEGPLLAVIDGLGHGDDAAGAAQEAAVTIERYAMEPLDEILRRCHAASGGTRGSAITLCQVDLAEATLAWSGVGNVAGCLLRSGATSTTKAISSRPGIVGSRLPTLHTETLPLHEEDLIVLATDGIRPDFVSRWPTRRAVQRIADEVLAEQSVPTDDALLLVARYRQSSR